MNTKKVKRLVNKWLKLRERANGFEESATKIRESYQSLHPCDWIMSEEYHWDLSDKAVNTRRKMDRIQTQIEEAGIDFHSMLLSSSFSSLRRYKYAPKRS